MDIALFIKHAVDLAVLAKELVFCPHLKDDDTHIYGSSASEAACDIERRLSACVDDVCCWMQSNPVQVNARKTDLLRCTTARRQHQLLCLPLR